MLTFVVSYYDWFSFIEMAHCGTIEAALCENLRKGSAVRYNAMCSRSIQEREFDSKERRWIYTHRVAHRDRYLGFADVVGGTDHVF